MSYQVIARKWRPQTFEEVTGQEHITRTLRNAVEHERLHHAYLFSGARGVGKTTTARLLAKAVNCHKAAAPTPTPCRTTDEDACPSCKEIAEGRSIDVLEIDAASNTGVDNVRDAIINTVGVRPARDRYKVFIIDEVHMLSTAAFNALLKTLEEPPSRVLFIMATTHPHKVPETILSRSQQFEFRTIPASKIAERLRVIADAEKIKVSEDALREIARAGEGSMRDAQSAFDQVISFSEGKIDASDVEAALGLASSELLSRVTRAVAEQKPADVLAVVADLVARGHELRNFCRDLLAHLRDLLVVKVAGEAALGDAADSERRALQEEGRDFSESDLVRFFHSMSETEQKLRDGAHPRYQLEIGLVKLVEMRRLAPLGGIVERLNALEEALRTGRAPTGSAGTPGTPTVPPASNVPPRRGVGGGGASSFAPQEQAAPQTPVATAATDADVRPHPSPKTNGLAANAEPHATPAPAAADDGAARAASPANLKLVPPPAQGYGGTPSFARDAASRASEAPFPLADGADSSSNFFDSLPEVEAPRAGEDRVGRPVSLVPTTSPDESVRVTAPQESASSPLDDAGAYEDADSLSNRIRRGLEGRGKHLLAAALEGARRVFVDGDELRVEFAPESKHLYETLKKSENQKLLREVCCEVLGRAVGVGVTNKAAAEGGEEATPEDEARREKRLMRERAEGHPAVQQLLKTFRAEIVEVRPTTDTQPQ
ncbi:MAG TPA: DNA polymerase III subunit gamma/tau [Pyrinomonadaceae bacterium]|jgi:DNA polymerase-3 subunit gamma/tau|nr:DNA polymerase III subunit gamma/tau [Pyrinomonadaceae bacterium]